MLTAMGVQKSLLGLAVLLLLHIVYATKLVKFGALVNNLDAEEKAAYEFAIRSVNKDTLLMLTKLEFGTKDVYDIYSTSRKGPAVSTQVCALAREPAEEQPDIHGVAAIFGPTDPISATYVRSFSSRFKIPHIQFHPERDTTYSKMGAMSLNMHPDVESMAQAYRDLAIKMRWDKIIILTADASGLRSLKYLMSPTYQTSRDVVVLKLTDITTAVRTIKSMPGYKNVIVDIPLDSVSTFMRVASEHDLLSAYFHFHFTTMDLTTLSDEIGPLTTGAVNITSFAIVSNSTSRHVEDMKANWQDMRHSVKDFPMMLKTRNALIYDSIRYVAIVLEQLLKRSQTFATQKMHCLGQQTPNFWQYGEEFVQDLLKSKTVGVTGKILFDQHGRRTNFKLNLVEFDVDGLVTSVGYWTATEGVVITKPFEKVRSDVAQDITRRKFRVGIKMEEPFIIKRSVYDDGLPIPPESHNDRFVGFCIDLMAAIANELKISDYEYVEVFNGSKRNLDNTWTGIVGGLIAREYDLAISPITMTYERSQFIDFSAPYLDLGISILGKKPEQLRPEIMSFMQPFENKLWLCIFAALFGTAIVLHCVGRFSPGEWDNPHPCSPEVDILENSLTPANSLWFVFGTFLCQGSEVAPKAGATRIIACFWWLFCLICVASYTANLAAFLTKSKMSGTIKNADDLSRQNKVKYGSYSPGTTREFFRTSEISTYAKMNTFMEENPQYLQTSAKEAIEEVKKGGFMYLMESVPLRYVISQNCDLEEVGYELSKAYYSVGFPPGSPYTNDFSEAILKLQIEQVIIQLYNRWWLSDKCKEDTTSNENSSKLGLDNFMGVYIIFAALLLAATVICIIEFIAGALLRAKERKVSFCRELWYELKFQLCCAGEKPSQWDHDQLNDNPDEDSLAKSLDRLDLSLGSLTTGQAPSEFNATSRTMDSRATRHRSTRSARSAHSLSGSLRSLDVTRETTADSEELRSLVTVIDNNKRKPMMGNGPS